MDVEFFIHGVPKGESFWGKSEEKNFLGQFYDGKTDVEKMYIYSRSLNGANFVYYTYLVSNTIDVNGCSGGYFGMTLRMDAYCLDYIAMYQILSLVYRNHIVGSILQIVKDRVQYKIGDFGNFSDVLKDIQNKVFGLMQTSFGSTSFLQIPKIMAEGGKSIVALNLYDYSQEDVMKCVSSYSRIVLSPYYASKKVAELKNGYDKQVDIVQKQCNQQILQEREIASKDKKSLSCKLQEMTSSMSALQSEMKEKDDKINSLQNQVRQMEATIRQQGKLRKIEGVVTEIKNPLATLVKLLGEIVPLSKDENTNVQPPVVSTKKKKEKFSFFPFFRKALTPVLLLVLLGMVCVLGYQIKTKISGVVDQVDCLHKQNKRVESNQRSIFKMMRSVGKTNSDVQASETSNDHAGKNRK